MSPTSTLSKSNSRTSCTISVIYEDRAAGIRAKRFADNLTSAVATENRGSIEMWRCELLEFPQVAELVASETASAQYLILSLRGDAGLSRWTKHFLESWLSARTAEAPLLIALFDRGHGTSRIAGSVCSYLEHVAGAAGVPFISEHTLATSAPLSQPNLPMRKTPRNGRVPIRSESLAA